MNLMKKILIMGLLTISAGFSSQAATKQHQTGKFNYVVDQFYDMQILRYRVPGFEDLTLKQKELIYFLNQAALEGRDIIFDQNYKHNLCIRRTLEAAYQYGKADTSDGNYKAIVSYLKRVWVSNGIHHHYSMDKFEPDFTKDFFRDYILSVPANYLPLSEGETPQQLVDKLIPILFNPKIDSKRVNLEDGVDLLQTSACNYYHNVSQYDVEKYYSAIKEPDNKTPISYGLNSRLVRENGALMEKVWKTDGLYGQALTKIVFWLEKAITVAENDQQKAVITKLIEYYKNGDLKTFDDYSVLWVEDIHSLIDFVNGFIETYGDPLGLKASWESIVNFKNLEATKRTEIISSNAQWFEDNSPVDPKFKKEKVKGVTAKVITATILAGDCYPTTPIGVNLPNANWIRRDHGSKSVTIENITQAYDEAAKGNGFNEEFMWSDVERKRAEKYGFLTDNLHTDLHECLGHGSGKLLPGVDPDALKAYGATIEEARADLFGLYYLADPKMVSLKLVPDKEAYKAEYYKYMMNGLMTQLTRILPGKNIEESHMRNRALIARWCYEKGKDAKVIEFAERDGKTYVVINNYETLRKLLGQLLAEIQRIKSTGDFEGARNLVENYSVKVDSRIHMEVLYRYNALNLAPYKGFVNPVYTPEYTKEGAIKDIKISYTEGFVEQNLRYSHEFGNLPTYN
jgi:dipeptidyl-peptidase III